MRMMISQTAYERLRGELAAFGDTLEFLIMTPDRRIVKDGRELSLGDVEAEVVWATFDVFGGSEGLAYFGALIPTVRAKWVHSSAAGYDGAIFRQLVSSGVILTTSHVHAIGIAEFVIAGVLDHFQGGPERRAAQAEKTWRRFPAREVMSSTWLILGFGSIGQAIAQRTLAFGARVIGIRRDQSAHPFADMIAPLADIPALLPEADVVVGCIPHRADTRRLANAAFFGSMKPGSVFVNVGRGALVDDAALLDALDKGRPAHAILDVFDTEPLPREHRFWSHPRVALTAHSSPMSEGQQARLDALFLENLRRYLAKEPLRNVASPADVLAA